MTSDPITHPRILALDTTGRAGSLLLAEGPHVRVVHALDPQRRHAVELMPALAELCQQLGWTPGSLQHIYIAQGPGSFTGLRIAVAVARALHLATGCKLVGVPSLEVIAHNAPAAARTIAVALDAKRGQVFGAVFTRNDAGALTISKPPALYTPAELLADLPAPVYVLGEGIDYHRPALQAAGMGTNYIIETDPTLWPGRAELVHQLGWQRASRGEWTAPEALLPIYIRLPEAEEVWRKKHGLAL